MTELRVGYFLEDLAHEKFFVAMVERIAGEFNCSVIHDVRSARGGHAIEEWKVFIRDLKKGYQQVPEWHILLVAIDANQKRWNQRKQEIEQEVQDVPLPCLVVAVPSPYIQAWFLLDITALEKALETVGIQIQWVKIKKGKKVDFKDTFARTVREALGFPAQYEVYGDDIARYMDLAIQTNTEYLREPRSSFDKFIKNLKECLARLCPQN
ncbi:MAG: hypothetical protein ABIM88_07910 [candidate division WOR-3 bacterium]